MEKWEKPSEAAIDYAIDLATQLRIEDRYDWAAYTKDEISELIDEFKDRLGLK